MKINDQNRGNGEEFFINNLRMRQGSDLFSINLTIDALFPRTQEGQEIDPFIPTGLANTQQQLVILDAPLICKILYYVTQPCKGFYRMFCIIVVPRNAIMLKECKELVLVFFEPFLNFAR